jgi:hypothetical protein
LMLKNGRPTSVRIVNNQFSVESREMDW